jgi:cellulose synthase operon protein YhjQ
VHGPGSPTAPAKADQQEQSEVLGTEAVDEGQMTDVNPLRDPNETPEDVATLYSWANLHGAKYRDFSAARAQTREKARLRAEQSTDAQRRGQQETEPLASPSAQPLADLAARQSDWGAQQAAEQAQQAARQLHQAAQQAAEQASHMAAKQAQEQAARLAAEQATEQAAQYATDQPVRQRPWQSPRPERLPASLFSTPAAPYSPSQSQSFDYAAYGRPQAPSQPTNAPVREEGPILPRGSRTAPDIQETVGRPAWLSADRQEASSQTVSRATLPGAPDDTLQGSRDRMTSRWFALRGIFDPTPAPPEVTPAPAISRAPTLAVFSLAGGVGKTSMVATLGRALAARGERVLLVDTAAFGLLPFFFGATDQRPGQLRTFNPPGVSSDAPIQMVTIDPESLSADGSNQESLSGEISKYSRGVSRVIVDLATASGATTRRIIRMSPMVLVPVIPDMNSVVSVSSIDAFFEHNSNPASKPSFPYYVLNQFDPSLPLHLDVREVLREQVGERLLPFALHRTPVMSEALAEGMTVMDYAPNCPLAEDFAMLAGWVKGLSSAAMTSYRGVRWSER